MSRFKDFFKLLIGAALGGATTFGLADLFSRGTGGGMHHRNRSDQYTSKRRGSAPQGYYGRPRWGRTLNGGI